MKDLSTKALKSGIWYTFANFLTKSIGIITTPIFARMLTKAELGAYGNYTSWLSVLMVLVTMNMESTFITAKFDHEKNFDSYVSSVLVFSSCSAVFCMILLNVFSGFAVQKMNMDLTYINCMCVYLFFVPALHLYQTKERFQFGYKKSVLVSCLVAVTTALVSVLLVKTMSNRLSGRVFGAALPTVLIGLVVYCLLLRSGHKLSMKYIWYALPICLPYIPHLLSMTFLNSLDKMMITDIRGEEENALYTIAYQCSSVITILITSLNSAFAPWLGEKLHDNSFSEIRSFAKKYILIFMYFAIGIMLVSPEIMMFMGGKPYMEAKYVMPPVMLGCVCQFVYTMYVNVEQFNKKTIGMALASASAALLNYVLNYLMIPKYGYIAAAYTTLVSFIWLLGVHMFLVYRLKLSKVYPNKYILVAVGFASIVTIGINVLYGHTILRYAITVLYGCVFIYAVIHYREQLLQLLKKKTSK